MGKRVLPLATPLKQMKFLAYHKFCLPVDNHTTLQATNFKELGDFTGD
jgi:hypothetical protein